jgi:hypothetical protein
MNFVCLQAAICCNTENLFRSNKSNCEVIYVVNILFLSRKTGIELSLYFRLRRSET